MTKLLPATGAIVLAGAVILSAGLAAQETAGPEHGPAIRPQRPNAARSKTQPPLKPYAAYVVGAPDVLLIEVLEALPGRPISGKHPVQPDGTVSLGFYGEVPVEGLTLPEIKARVVLHLRKHLDDNALGLLKLDPESGQPEVDPKTKEPVLIDPQKTDRVFVDVAAYYSKFYHVQGAFREPRRVPITGKERVLDAIHFGGGLDEEADHASVVLYRQGASGQPAKTLPIDVDQITLGDDLSTNYQLEPGDRLIARKRAGAAAREETAGSSQQKLIAASSSEDGPAKSQAQPDRERGSGEMKPRKPPVESLTKAQLERRIAAMERKIDRIIEALKTRNASARCLSPGSQPR